MSDGKTVTTKSHRIRTVYFWTKKQLDEAKREAIKLAAYFAGGESCQKKQ